MGSWWVMLTELPHGIEMVSMELDYLSLTEKQTTNKDINKNNIFYYCGNVSNSIRE